MSIESLWAWAEQEIRQNSLLDEYYYEQLKQLTVIIPTYERQDVLLRQVAYWGNSQATVVIVDGSSSPLPRDVLSAIGKLLNLRYLYSPTPMHDRLRLASEHIQTPYAVMHGDDEFFLKSSLCRVIDRLDADSGLSACNGQSIGFKYVTQDGAGSVEYYDAGYTHWRYAVEGGSAKDRLLFAMNSYNAATSYAVLRAPVWANSWGDVREWTSPYAGEMYQAIATYLAGRLETIDEPLMLRSGENPPVSSASSFNRRLQFYDWWQSPQYKSERIDFSERLVRKAMCETGLDSGEASAVVSAAVETYIRYCAIKAKWSWVRESKNWIRARISDGLRKLLPPSTFAFLKRRIGRSSKRAVLDNSPASNNVFNPVLERELQQIERLVKRFYEVRESVCVKEAIQ